MYRLLWWFVGVALLATGCVFDGSGIGPWAGPEDAFDDDLGPRPSDGAPDLAPTLDAKPCKPQCAGRVCGSDGCGGTCGPGCPQTLVCAEAHGLCVLREAETLAHGPFVPSDVAVDDVAVYWSTFGGAVRRRAHSGEVETLAQGVRITGLALTADHVYYVDAAQSTLARVARQGGAAEPLATELHRPRRVVVRGAHVYWIEVGEAPEQGAVRRMPLAGGQPETLVDGRTSPWDLAADEDAVYWLEGKSVAYPPNARLLRVPLAGGATTLLGEDTVSIGALCVADEAVFFADRTNNGVRRVSKLDGVEGPFVVGFGRPQGVASDATHLYWTNTDGSVLKVTLAGHGLVTLAADRAAGPTELVLGGDHVYWIEGVEAHPGLEGRVMRVRK